MFFNPPPQPVIVRLPSTVSSRISSSDIPWTHSDTKILTIFIATTLIFTLLIGILTIKMLNKK